MFYSTKQASAIFKITPQTMNVWAREFAQYLSDVASPGGNKRRRFTKDDMRVFSLVSDMQNEGLAFTDIHATLKSGSRGDAPLVEPEEMQAIVSSEVETRLSFENERLRNALVSAQGSLKKAQMDLARMREVEDENIKLKTRLEDRKEIEQRFETEIEELKKEVRDLSRQVGHEYARGFVDGIREQDSKGQEDKDLRE